MLRFRHKQNSALTDTARKNHRHEQPSALKALPVNITIVGIIVGIIAGIII